MRLYEMLRDEDISQVSGTGPVGQIVEFDSGEVAVSFYLHTAGVPNVIVYHDLDDAIKIHGHAGRTRVVPVNVPTAFKGRDGWKPAE